MTINLKCLYQYFVKITKNLIFLLLEEMEQMWEFFIAAVSLQSDAGEVGQLVGVLAGGWDRDRAAPVEVHVTQFVRQSLEFVGV